MPLPLSHQTRFSGKSFKVLLPEHPKVGEGRTNWSEVKKHHRYLSEFDDDVIRIDIAHHQADTVIERSFDLRDIYLQCSGESIYEGLVPLVHFRNLVDALKYMVNRFLKKFHRGGINETIGPFVRIAVRIFIYLIRRAIYVLAEVSPQILEDFVVELAANHWYGLLEYDRCLTELANEAEQDPELAQRLIGSMHTEYASLSIADVECALGMPAPWRGFPEWFRDRVRKAAHDNRKTRDVPTRKETQPVSEVRDAMKVLNGLATHKQGGDTFNFFPFPLATAKADGLAPSLPGRTRNIELEQYLAIFSESLRWLYDRRVVFIELLERARDVLVEEHRRVIKGEIVEKRGNDIARARIKEIYLELNVTGLLPYDDITIGNGFDSLSGMVKTAQTAMFVIIAGNHGRRSNEVIGKGVPYGLGLSALRSDSNGFKEWTIEFYIEKTVQDYDLFMANELVADAVSFLIDIYDIFRDVDEERPALVPRTREEGRKLKLFTHRTMTPQGLVKPRIELSLRADMTEFFRLANVDQKLFAHSMLPFRRMFVCLHLWRYDCPEAMAISRHMRHFSFLQTVPYGTDSPDGRAKTLIKDVLARRRAETAQMEKAAKELNVQYLTEKIEALFSGEMVGGGFPFLVRALAKRLATRLSFREKPIEDKAKIIAETLDKRGFSPGINIHGPCMAGEARHTIKMANCQRDGELHREEASPKMCHNCIHHYNNANYIRCVRADAENSRKMAGDYHLPKALRLAHAEHAKSVDKLIEMELSLCDRVREAYASLVSSWQVVVDGETVDE